ncbi:MAG: hypothetical protein B6D68_01810 [spirochete symbiont of Stewartia floridana]|nr:MAG: hypothetical protein B6D68_01810 [spirochete symbiont of Stewartia floridana]
MIAADRIFPNAEDITHLIDWFAVHGRTYPWSVVAESMPDPYVVWVSEVMLQQTTVPAVLRRFQSWIDQFPDIESLADASQDEVLRAWEGLGYYSRAKNMHSAAREVCRQYGSKLPSDTRMLRKLPGVGDYIASAVVSFAYGGQAVTIEANGRRVIQRVKAAKTWKRSLEREFKTAAAENIPHGDMGRFNAALMQFGQLICLPRKPNCGDCPLLRRCLARTKGVQDDIPVLSRMEVIKKTTDLALIMKGDDVWVKKRGPGIAAGLWGFPSLSELISPNKWRLCHRLDIHIHAYTKYKDELHPGVYRLADESEINAQTDMTKSSPSNKTVHERMPNPTLEGRWADEEALNQLGMPTAHRLIARNLYQYPKSSIM